MAGGGFHHVQIGIIFWEHPDYSLAKAVMVEFWCMALFLFLGVGTVCSGCHIAAIDTAAAAVADAGLDCPLTSARVVEIALVFGFSIATLVYASASFSGGHLNPAVSLACLITRKISALRGVLYVAAQMAGAALGCYVVSIVDPSGWTGMSGGINAPAPGQTDVSTFTLELVLTALLVFIVFCATDAERAVTAAHIPVLAPFAVGFAVFIAHLCAIPLDGCSINPARSFGSALIAGVWTKHWLFWAGPSAGGVVAAVFYELALRPHMTPLSAPTAARGEDQPETVALPAYAGFGGNEQEELRSPLLASAGNTTASV